MDYNNFKEETKTFMNKAMDIYSTIVDMEIVQFVEYFGRSENYKFKKLDKKILSLFIAGFMVDGNLKDILGEYDDIKLQDLLDFLKINENDINKLEDDGYSSFYEKYFRLDMESIMKNGLSHKNINFITPEVIISSLEEIECSDILNYFSNMHGLGAWFNVHPLFKALKNHTFIDGSVSKKNLPKGNNIGMLSPLAFDFLPKMVPGGGLTRS